MLLLCASIGMYWGDNSTVNVAIKKKVPSHFLLCASFKIINLMVLSPVVTIGTTYCNI